MASVSPTWFGNDEMTIDYIKVYQLKTDCNDDVLISNAQDLTDFQPSVKRSIVIEPSSEFAVPQNTDINMRAVESIVIDKGFTIPQGVKITMQTHLCPE